MNKAKSTTKTIEINLFPKDFKPKAGNIKQAHEQYLDESLDDVKDEPVAVPMPIPIDVEERTIEVRKQSLKQNQESVSSQVLPDKTKK